MEIKTKYFGTIDVKEETIIRFEQGIPGFPEEQAFVFLPLEETVFTIMQSTMTPELAFVTCSPFEYFPSYEIKLKEEVLEQLQIKELSEVIVLVILSVNKPFENSTANLVAPIVFNPFKQLGKQVVIDNTTYNTKHPLPIPVKEAD